MYTNIYLRIIKNGKNHYDFIFFNKNKKIWLNLNISYNKYLKQNYKKYLTIVKCFLYENGFKLILLKNWYNYGIKYNFILNLFK